jgi:hypothetical protein
MNTFLEENEIAARKWKAAHQLPKCGSCKWWLPVWLGGRGPMIDLGVCKRFPRYVRPFMGHQQTKADDWCGEHKPAGQP